MARKLKVELDVDTSQAKRKVQSDLKGSVSGTSSREVREFSAQMRQATKLFGGMAIRLAANYAAQSMEQGSTAQKAVSIGGGMAAGALMGANFGPLGAAAGALAGAAEALLGVAREEKEKIAARDKENYGRVGEVDTWRERGDQMAKDRAFFDEPATWGNLKGKDLIDAQIKSLVERLEAAEKRKLDADSKVQNFLNTANFADMNETERQEADEQRRYLMGEYNKFDQMAYNFSRALEAKREELANFQDAAAFRESVTGVDAIARIGGDTGGGQMDAVRIARDQLTALKNIEQNTKGGATWQ